MIMGHSLRSDYFGALNLTCISTILSGCRQKAVSTFFLTTFDGVPLVAIGCLAPEFVFDLTISNGPLTLKLKVKSAFVSLEKVSLRVIGGASSAAIAHF